MTSSFSPRVIGNNRADFSTMESFLKFKKFDQKENEELILAIYDYLTSTVDGSYHWWDMEEDKGDPTIKGRVIDPVKLFNVYGWLICGQIATCLYRIYTTAGYKARQFGAPGHSLCEVYYDNSWHFLDVDMWTWFKNKNNKIASAYELSQDAFELIVTNKNKSNPCNLPDRKIEDYANMFRDLTTTDGDIDTEWPEFSIQSHTMDFHLRPGESMSRSMNALGRFHLPNRFIPMMTRYGSEWKGHPSERYEPFRTYGNGKWVYEPNLSNKFQDYSVGVWENKGISQIEKGLVGSGFSVFRILSPYVFCGIPKLENKVVTTSNGVFVKVKGHGPLSLEISNVENEWVLIKSWNGAFDEIIDITENFDGRYNGLIKITQKEKSVLEIFKFDGYIQTAPMSIPRLEKGKNEFTVLENDKLNLKTTPYHLPVDFRENKGLAKKILNCKNGEVKIERPGWLTILKVDENKPLQVDFKFTMPENKKIAWCYVYTILKETKWGGAKGFATLEFSENGITYQKINSREITQTRQYWDCSLEGQVQFKTELSEFYFRVTSDTSISGFHCYGHMLEADHKGVVKIKHQWKEISGVKTFDAPLGKSTYSLTCGDFPAAHAIEMSVESLPKP